MRATRQNRLRQLPLCNVHPKLFNPFSSSCSLSIVGSHTIFELICFQMISTDRQSKKSLQKMSILYPIALGASRQKSWESSSLDHDQDRTAKNVLNKLLKRIFNCPGNFSLLLDEIFLVPASIRS